MKKRITICVLVGLILGAGWCLCNSEWYLEKKLEHKISRVLQLEKEYKEYGWLADFAERICEEAGTDGIYLSCHEDQRVLREQYGWKTAEFLGHCAVEFDQVYVGGMTHLIYPEGACVFRSTIKDRRGVYAWVDLVYAPNLSETEQKWYQSMAEGSTQINAEWYISVLYGY